MSLINQVLRDLDRRQASGVALAVTARSLPQPKRGRPGRLPLAAIVLSTAAGAGIAVATVLAGPSLPMPTPMPERLAMESSRPAAGPQARSVPSPSSMPLPMPMPSQSPAESPMPQGPTRQPASAVQETAAPASTAPTPPSPFAVLQNTAPGPRPTLVVAPKADAAFVASPTLVTPPTVVARLAPPAGPRAEPSVEKRIRPGTPRERADAEYQRGLGLHAQGQDKEAAAAFAAAVREDRTHATARQSLAVALIGSGELDPAQAVLADGLELDPRDVQLASTLARVRLERHDGAGAIGVLKAAIAGSPADAGRPASADARALLATLQQRAGQHAEAIDNYGSALRAGPGHGAWWIGLSVSLAAEGRAADAREALQRARATETLTPELERFVEQRLRASP